MTGAMADRGYGGSTRTLGGHGKCISWNHRLAHTYFCFVEAGTNKTIYLVTKQAKSNETRGFYIHK